MRLERMKVMYRRNVNLRISGIYLLTQYLFNFVVCIFHHVRLMCDL